MAVVSSFVSWPVAVLVLLGLVMLGATVLLELLAVDACRELLRGARSARERRLLWLTVIPFFTITALMPLSVLALPLAVVFLLPTWCLVLAALPFLVFVLGLALTTILASGPVERRRARPLPAPVDPREEFAASVLRDLEALPLLAEDELDYRH